MLLATGSGDWQARVCKYHFHIILSSCVDDNLSFRELFYSPAGDMTPTTLFLPLCMISSILLGYLSCVCQIVVCEISCISPSHCAVSFSFPFLIIPLPRSFIMYGLCFPTMMISHVHTTIVFNVPDAHSMTLNIVFLLTFDDFSINLCTCSIT